MNYDGSIVLSTAVDTKGINKGISKIKSDANGLNNTLKKVGLTMGAVFSVKQLAAFSIEAGKVASNMEASLYMLQSYYGSSTEIVGKFVDENSRALGIAKSAMVSYASVYGNLFSVWADQETNAKITNEYLNMTAVIASKTGRTVEDVQERLRSGLLGNTEAIEDLGVFVNVKTIEMSDAFKRMANGKSWNQLDAYTQSQIRAYAILEQSSEKYGKEVLETTNTVRNQYAAAYEDFKNSWGNIVNTILIPVLKILTRVFDVATKGLNALSGRSNQVNDNIVIEETTEQTADNIKEQAENQKDLNKEMKKTLAAFDEIQILSAGDEEEQPTPQLDLSNMFGDEFEGSNYVKEVGDTFDEIMGIIAVSLLALGCILLFTGHIGWALGFIFAGAAAFGVSAQTLKDAKIKKKVKDTLSNSLIIAGVVAITIGILLCMAQLWGIGIGLIAIGAASVATPVTLNWDGIAEQLQTSFGGWLVLGGYLAIVLGILLCFTPMLPLGIGLIVLGAGAMVAPIVANWDFITNKMTEIFSDFAGIVAAAGTALIVIGIILCCTGVGIGLGIGLILAGAASLGKVVAVNWNSIVDWVKGAWDAVRAFWNQNIAPIFTANWWLQLGKNCINGLISGFEGGINGIIGAFESMINWIVDGLNKISFDIPDWLGGGSFGINLPRANFNRVKIPRLAQGSVIPPNREFLAVLGDNKKEHEIVSPVSTMKQAFAEAIQEMGFGGQVQREEHYYLDETELMSIIYRLVKGGGRIEGNNLAIGGGF